MAFPPYDTNGLPVRLGLTTDLDMPRSSVIRHLEKAIEKKVMMGRTMRSAYWLSTIRAGWSRQVTVRRLSDGVTHPM